jgi:hypothetical protein
MLGSAAKCGLKPRSNPNPNPNPIVGTISEIVQKCDHRKTLKSHYTLIK